MNQNHEERDATESAVLDRLLDHNFVSASPEAQRLARTTSDIANEGNSRSGTVSDLGAILIEASDKLEPVEDAVRNPDGREYPGIQEAIVETIREMPYVATAMGERKADFIDQIEDVVRNEIGHMPMPGLERHALKGMGEAIRSAGRDLQRGTSKER